MKLVFSWETRHRRLDLRIVRASGDAVQIVGDGGVRRPVPPRIANGTVLDIAPECVAYGAAQNWFIRAYVDEVVFVPMTGLSIVAMYDDCVDPAAIEAFVEQRTLQVNMPVDLDRTLNVPRRA